MRSRRDGCGDGGGALGAIGGGGGGSGPEGVDDGEAGGGIGVSGGGGRGCSEELNVAVTPWGALMVRTHGTPPEQSPCQPAKREPTSDVAVRVTLVPVGKLALQL